MSLNALHTIEQSNDSVTKANQTNKLFKAMTKIIAMSALATAAVACNDDAGGENEEWRLKQVDASSDVDNQDCDCGSKPEQNADSGKWEPNTDAAVEFDANQSNDSQIPDCPIGQARCAQDNSCIDMMSSNDHCGLNCQKCTGGKTCENGVCITKCQDGLEPCNNICRQLEQDNENCGSCGNICDKGTQCLQGKCQPIQM